MMTLPLSQAESFPSRGCVGSVRWGIDTGRAFDVKGIRQYGRTITNADSHADAMAIVLSWDCLWDEEAFTFIAPKVMTVSQVGPKHDYMRSEQRYFMVSMGVPVEVTHA
jgi:hypothetical protein